MTKSFTALLAAVVAGAPAFAGDCKLPAWPCYEFGMPVPILFEQTEDIEGWDGGISWCEVGGKRRLEVSNCCFLVVTRGLGDFKRSANKEVPDLGGWRTNLPPRGELVQTKGLGPDHVQYSVRLPGPFSTLVDLAEIYDLRMPGVYTVYWGHDCRQGWQCKTEIMFEILPKGALQRAADQVDKLLNRGQ